MEPQYVPEVDTLVAVVRWLHQQGWTIESLSIARGQGIDSVGNRNRVKGELAKLCIQEKGIVFVSEGADVVAKKDGVLWRIECKGLAESMKSPTMRNQFDRLLAAVVSHYDRAQGLQLGMALPEEYRKYVNTRLPQVLRTALNLWVLLYISADEEIVAFAPHEEFHP